MKSFDAEKQATAMVEVVKALKPLDGETQIRLMEHIIGEVRAQLDREYSDARQSRYIKDNEEA